MSDTRILGRGLEVSAIGLGCMGFTHAYGPPADEAEAARVIREAVDLGYTFFDTAECYIGKLADGAVAYNEELVGRALREVRNQVRIATKFGVRHEGGALAVDSRPEAIRTAVEGSLKRLGTDYIDLYYQHRIDPKVPAETVAVVMQELMQQGRILHWGISEADEAYLRAAHAVCPVTCIQNRYSMLARWHEAIFPVLEELNIGYVGFSPLANGVLSDAYSGADRFGEDDFRRFMPQYTEEAFTANQELLALIRQYAREKQATPAQISLAWMLNKKPYIVPIPGSRKLARVKENIGAVKVALTLEEVRAIDKRLDLMKISAVFGGSPLKREQGG